MIPRLGACCANCAVMLQTCNAPRCMAQFSKHSEAEIKATCLKKRHDSQLVSCLIFVLPRVTQYNRHVLGNCVGSSSLLTGPGVAMKGLIAAMVDSVKHFCWVQELLASNPQEVFSGSFQQDCQRLVKGCR